MTQWLDLVDQDNQLKFMDKHMECQECSSHNQDQARSQFRQRTWKPSTGFAPSDSQRAELPRPTCFVIRTRNSLQTTSSMQELKTKSWPPRKLSPRAKLWPTSRLVQLKLTLSQTHSLQPIPMLEQTPKLTLTQTLK